MVNFVGMIIRTGGKVRAQDLHQDLSRRLLRRVWPWTDILYLWLIGQNHSYRGFLLDLQAHPWG